jgi:hypothetical protein
MSGAAVPFVFIVLLTALALILLWLDRRWRWPDPPTEEVPVSDTHRPWLGLDRELTELERADPKVRAAREALDRVPDAQASHERHIAARRAVGKRAVPEDEP